MVELSKYQKKIIDWVLNGKGNACCNAVAGSGKSTTLKMAAMALKEAGVNPYYIKIIVFGKANAQDLINKFGPAWKQSICTLHSAGYHLVKKELDILRKPRLAQINDNKYKKIAQRLKLLNHKIGKDSYVGSLLREDAIAHESDFMRLIHLVRMTNQPPIPEVIEELCFHFQMPEVFEFQVVASAINDCLIKGEFQARRRYIFDFTDQIWLPVKWCLGAQSWFETYQYVLVDECQDLNASQLELSLMLAGKKGRLLYVGDPRQAIMGFAGADCDSYNNILKRTKATELPLSLCYRCPKTHIQLVNTIFPSIPIEAHSQAKEGMIAQIKESELDKELNIGDMVLSRKTAPLVTLCIKLISKGIAARVKGKDIGKLIQRELEEIEKMPNFQYIYFNEALRAYRDIKVQRFEGLDNEEELTEALNDKLNALQAIYQGNPQATSIADLLAYIESLFSDEESPISLSTCHRAKGLEGDRVFILRSEDMPLHWKKQLNWQLEQEKNLLYVALTRSKSELFIVGEPEWFKQVKIETVKTSEKPFVSSPKKILAQTIANLSYQERTVLREAIKKLS